MSNFASERPCRLKSSKYLKKPRESNSPTQSSSRSNNSIWARSYKNQPIPAQLRTRLIGKKFQFNDSDDSEQQVIVTVEQEQQHEQMQKKTRLPKFKVISDEGQFIYKRRNRLYSQNKPFNMPQRCHSMAPFKLPQVVEQKKEDDEHRKKGLSKLNQFKDNNQFGQNKRKRKSSSDLTEVVSRVQSMDVQPTHLSRGLPQKILENEAEQTRSVKMQNDKSIITAQLQKIIVDEVDQKKKKKQQEDDQIQSIIEQVKPEMQVDKVDTEKLSQLLSKFEEQSNYLTQINDQEDFSKKSNKNPQVIIQKVQQSSELE